MDKEHQGLHARCGLPITSCTHPGEFFRKTVGNFSRSAAAAAAAIYVEPQAAVVAAVAAADGPAAAVAAAASIGAHAGDGDHHRLFRGRRGRG